MAAAVIPFPRRRPAAEPDRYATTFKERVTEIFASAAAETGLLKHRPKEPREQAKILRRLRRIERRLDALVAAGSFPDAGMPPGRNLTPV